MAYLPNYSSQFAQIIADLKSSKVAVIGHIRPDGDCIGSQVGLVRALQSLGIDAIALNQHPVPHYLQPFLGDTPWTSPESFDSEGYSAITVDCSNRSRIGNNVEKLFPEILLNIDHHLSNDNFAKHNIVIPEYAATTQILAALFLDNSYKIDPVAAQALYVGIATDTGQFRFTNTNKGVFEIASKLMNLGANPSDAANQLYENDPVGRLILLREFLGTLKLELHGQVCVGWVTQEMYQLTDTSKEHIEGFVDYPRSIQSVHIAALIEESTAGLKVSLRAKKDKFRVDLLASSFGGGGHACAAGFTISNKKITEFYNEFIYSAQNHIKNINVHNT